MNYKNYGFSQISNNNIKELEPFIGPRPFERKLEDQQRFYGRRYETREIKSLISSHSLVLIYGKSGSGKTSLFNAQIIPILERDKFEVLPVARVRMAPAIQFILKSNNINCYMLSVLQSLKPEVDFQLVLNMDLSNFLETYLLNKSENSKSYILIFDQIEELFNYYPHKNWKEQQESFFRQIANTLNNLPQLSIIFIIREEYLAELDPFVSIMPERLRPRFRIDYLTKDDARLAIKGPLHRLEYDHSRQDNSGNVDDEIEMLINDLSIFSTVDPVSNVSSEIVSELVNPIQLQVIFQKWWYSRLSSNNMLKKPSNHKYYSVEHDALNVFYDDVIHNVSKETNIVEGKIRSFCETSLITVNGKRRILHKNDFTNEIPYRIMDSLEKKNLITTMSIYGEEFYELTHDRLISSIKLSNRLWYQQRNWKSKLSSILQLSFIDIKKPLRTVKGLT